ncbi:MAG: hypothetical protein LC785_11735 [Acidobacteria bacterium]|nr:hypothetical protein [Acidobacteriota bacterium]MCA1642596.1 hypothetical protein [Acidobacteriota bacterium]
MKKVKELSVNAINRLFSLGFLLLLTTSAFSQERKIPVVEHNLYDRALFASLGKMDKEWSHIDDAAMGNRIRIDYHNMIVEKNRNITEGLPSQLGEYRVEYLDAQELIDRYKRLRKEFAILVAYPMVNEGERLEITFNVYWIGYIKGRLFYALSDWSKVYFRYDCEKREYVVEQVKLGGV